MADIINTPPGGGNNTGGWVLGLVAIVLLVLVLIFVIPNLTGDDTVETNPNDQAENTNNGINDIIPPVINNTTINSTSTTNINATTTDE